MSDAQFSVINQELIGNMAGITDILYSINESLDEINQNIKSTTDQATEATTAANPLAGEGGGGEGAAKEGGSKIGGILTKTFKMVGSGITKALGPLGVLLEVLQALGVAEPILEVMNAFISLLGIAFMPVVMDFVNMLTPLLPTVAALSLALQPLVSIIVSLTTNIGLFQLALPYLNTAITALTDVLNGVSWDSVKTWFEDLPSTIVGWLETNAYKIKDWFEALPGKIADWFDDMGSAILNGIKKLFGL